MSDDLPLVTCIGPHARIQMPRNFRPFTATGEAFRKHYPDLVEAEVVSDFINHHVTSGKWSTNWDAEFIGFCNHRQRQARERQTGEAGTDALGYTPGKPTALPGTEGDYGIRLLARIRVHLAAGLNWQDAKDAAVEDLRREDEQQ